MTAHSLQVLFLRHSHCRDSTHPELASHLSPHSRCLRLARRPSCFGGRRTKIAKNKPRSFVEHCQGLCRHCLAINDFDRLYWRVGSSRNRYVEPIKRIHGHVWYQNVAGGDCNYRNFESLKRNNENRQGTRRCRWPSGNSFCYLLRSSSCPRGLTRSN